MTQCAYGSHNTDVVTQWYEYEYRGHVQQVERSYTECQDCGLEFQTAEQIDKWFQQKRIAEFTIDQWILDKEGE